MHQPEYRVAGRFELPWVYLHAIGAYTDMAAHLQAVAGARAVVNFSPVLLDQLDDYARRLAAGGPVGDPLLDALRELPPIGPQRARVVRRCLPVQRNRRTDRHPQYLECAARAAAGAAESLPDAALADLLVWFHLGWIAQCLRADMRVRQLLARGGGFERDHRAALLALIAAAIAALLPRYRALAAAGQAELSMTPCCHPLLPLLLDFGSARDTAPGVELPLANYPGGAARARWHLQEGRRVFARSFGREPRGCWPAEAALSEAAHHLLGDAGFSWTASSGAVLAATQRDAAPFHAFRRDDRRTLCFFRDDGLSDRIGFAYKDWPAADAVADLVQHLERIAAVPERDLALIALDGENPWEYYADDGADFLRGLYGALAAHPRLRLATLDRCCEELAARSRPLPPIRAGSWVHGQLLTWIGHPEKNRAWSLLMHARARFDAQAQPGARAQAALGACEGSDWFWWPGAANPPASVADFDALFRAHLGELYDALGEPPPPELAQPFAAGAPGAVAAGGTMRPTGIGA